MRQRRFWPELVINELLNGYVDDRHHHELVAEVGASVGDVPGVSHRLRDTGMAYDLVKVVT